MSPSTTNILRGIALLGVVGIHLLSSLSPSPFYAVSGWQWLAIGLNQLGRISVPLFVLLSGYGLGQKYGKELGSLKQFFQRRVFKLLPEYLLWSIVFIVVFSTFEIWRSSQVNLPLIWQLVLGKADYHLYFVPMVFQLYALYPFLRKALRRQPLFTVLLALSVQLLWYWRFSYHYQPVVEHPLFIGDVEQYLWFPNWIGYFVLGMFLASPPNPARFKFSLPNWLTLVAACGGALLSWLFATNQAVSLIGSGIDPLIALRTTRYSVVVMSLLAVVLVLVVHKIFASRQVKWERKLPGMTYLLDGLKWLGKHSYRLYLSHTLMIRVVQQILRAI